MMECLEEGAVIIRAVADESLATQRQRSGTQNSLAAAIHD